MPYYCTVPRCTSMAGKAKNVSFHQFPRDVELAKLWNNILKRGKPYTKYSKVCSLHFRPEDYTITSVGKNKGQWRTLRKDAIPSQNLPVDSPAPHQRRQSGPWPLNSAPPVLDPVLQQQVAQAIYMQTMLAMQVAGATDPLTHNDPPPRQEESNKPAAHPSYLPDTNDNTSSDSTEDSTRTSYKCDDCSKCFKDPDVFTLHRRVHNKEDSVKETQNSASEKENLRNNPDMLKSNPILANLLKSQEGTFDRNILIENQLMSVLASNVESYIRNLSSMMSDNDRECDTLDDIESNRLVIDESV